MVVWPCLFTISQYWCEDAWACLCTCVLCPTAVIHWHGHDCSHRARSMCGHWAAQACLITLWHIYRYPPGDDWGLPVHQPAISKCHDVSKVMIARTLAESQDCHTAVWPHLFTSLLYFSTTIRWHRQAFWQPCHVPVMPHDGADMHVNIFYIPALSLAGAGPSVLTPALSIAAW